MILGPRLCKKRIVPLLTDAQKAEGKKLVNCITTNFNNEDTLKSLFSNEKLFNIDGEYNSQNYRVWAVNRGEANKNGGKKQKRKFPQKSYAMDGCLLKTCYIVGYSRQGNHKSREIHLADLATCFEIWKQDFRR